MVFSAAGRYNGGMQFNRDDYEWDDDKESANPIKHRETTSAA